MERDTRLPLYQHIRDEILDKISSGLWLPDKSIPTESELAKTYKVAVGTVRKAIDTLVNDGSLYRSQGVGTFVKRPDFNSSLFRFFRQIAVDGSRIVPKGKVTSCVLEDVTSALAKDLDLSMGDQVIKINRLRTIDEVVSLKEEIWLPNELFHNLINIELCKFDDLLYPFYEKQCGRYIVSAKETLTISIASKNIANDLNIPEGSPVVRIERIAFGYNKQPLEYRVSHTSAENFHYQVDIV